MNFYFVWHNSPIFEEAQNFLTLLSQQSLQEDSSNTPKPIVEFQISYLLMWVRINQDMRISYTVPALNCQTTHLNLKNGWYYAREKSEGEYLVLHGINQFWRFGHISVCKSQLRNNLTSNSHVGHVVPFKLSIQSIFMARPKSLLTQNDIHHRLESFGKLITLLS